jgi:hypothetical protein
VGGYAAMKISGNFLRRFFIAFFCTGVIVFCSAISFNISFLTDIRAVFTALAIASLIAVPCAFFSSLVLRRSDWMMIILSQVLAFFLLVLFFWD